MSHAQRADLTEPSRIQASNDLFESIRWGRFRTVMEREGGAGLKVVLVNRVWLG